MPAEAGAATLSQRCRRSRGGLLAAPPRRCGPLDHGQPTKAAAKTSLGRWVTPFTECRLPGVGSVVTITVAPLPAQIPLLAMAVHVLSPRLLGSHRSGTSSITQPGCAIAPSLVSTARTGLLGCRCRVRRPRLFTIQH
jgi:hypothetical protein